MAAKLVAKLAGDSWVIMDLSPEQVLTIQDYARRSRKMGNVFLFGSRAKGCAEPDSDVDLAVDASAGNWTALADTWERDLSERLGLIVHVRTLMDDAIRLACEEWSIPIVTRE